jgi:OOP family OmpA-OmpF porin
MILHRNWTGAAFCSVLLAFLALTRTVVAQTPDAELFANLLEARTAAQAAAAPLHAPDQLAEAEKLYGKALKAREKDKLDKARELGELAEAAFRQAELEAIESVLFAVARSRIAQARQQGATQTAPQSMALAEEHLAQADARLNDDRYDTEPAIELALRAERQAGRAIEITQIADAARSDAGATEALVLHWERRMADIAVAVAIEETTSLDADATSMAIVDAVQELLELREIVAEQNVLIVGLEDELRELDTQLGSAAANRATLIRQAERQARVREQFNQIRGLFEPEEAVVLRDGDDLILRLVGLRFTSNSATIEPSFAPLMAKIDRAIAVFPQCRLMVEGHTDSKGKVDRNQQLSIERAGAVMDYMTNTLRIPAFRIRATGYGDSRPIANNRTDEGRARNRRIDLIISPLPESL